MDFKNKVAIVTGGASGIGSEIVKSLLENEIQNVVIFDIHAKNGKALTNDLNEKYGKKRVMFVVADVTNDEHFEDAFQKTVDLFNNVDIFVNNAGIINEENYKSMIDINMTAMICGTKLGLKFMSKNKGGNGGVILNIASIAGLDGCYPVPIYSATKFGIIGLVHSIGHPYHSEESGVDIMALCPGFTTATFLGSAENCLSRKDREAIMNFFAITQMPDSVGRAAEYVIKHGSTGSIWIIEGGNLYKANIPDRSTYQELVLKNI